MLSRRPTRGVLMIPLAVVALVATASTVSAQGRPLFEWNGRVDREVRIAMRGRDAWMQSDNQSSRGRAQVATALPRQDGRVSVRVEDGRGDVDVIQQPSARNEYTTIVRIRDRSNGVDRYRVNAYWMPVGNGSWDGRGRDDDRYDRDDRWERDDDRWERGGRGNGDWGRGRGDSRYGQSALRWTGSVDDALEIRIQGSRVQYRTLSGKGVRDVRADVMRGGIPRAEVEVSVERYQGRGQITVVQQPSARNGYTAVIRISDPRPSYGDYAFDVTWRDRYNGRR